MKDIARDLNVSLITVSKALRGNTDISDATRERVLKRVRELDYKPNMMARSLATGRSFIMGLIVPDLLNPFLTELAQSLADALRRHDYALIVTSSGGDPEIERSEIPMMLARGVDALLLASCQESPKEFSAARPQTPVVLVDRPFPHLHGHFVGSDDRAGGRLATDHLLDLGRRRIAYIGSPDLGPTAERYNGFREALSGRKVPLQEGMVLPSRRVQDADIEGYAMMQQLLRSRLQPDGVFCHNDMVAIGAMRAALNAGISIPRAIAFVGFDDVRFSRYLPIPLTSISQQTREIGEQAAALAVTLATRTLGRASRILLTPRLVVRESSVGATATPIRVEPPSPAKPTVRKKPGRTAPPK